MVATGASWRSRFRASLDVVSVSRAPMSPGGLETLEIWVNPNVARVEDATDLGR